MYFRKLVPFKKYFDPDFLHFPSSFELVVKTRYKISITNKKKVSKNNFSQ